MTTLTQLKYIVALDKHRNFVKASEKCFVTQPTLSLQIQKLEDYLQVKIFDRTRQPVVPTTLGKEILTQARIVLKEAEKIEELINQQRGQIKGEFHLGIIPSVASSLIPLFLADFIKDYPEVDIHIDELQTEVMLEKLEREEIDAGIAATPLYHPSLEEHPLYNENLLVYFHEGHPLANKSEISPGELNIDDVLIMAEGHCFKNQALQLCKLKKKSRIHGAHFESNSFQTLINLVDAGVGITLLPELVANKLSRSQKNLLRPFKGKPPQREISLIYRRSLIKEGILSALKSGLNKGLKPHFQGAEKGKILDPM